MLEPKEKVLELMKLIVDGAPEEQLSAKATEIRAYFSALCADHNSSYEIFRQLLERYGIQCA